VVLCLVACLAQDFLKMDVDELPLAVQAPPNDSPFMLGPAAGYVRMREADHGGWYGGLMARVRLAPFLGIEASGGITQSEFSDDVNVQQIPVQLSAVVFPFHPDLLRPYAAAGAGWYPTEVDYHGALSGLSNDRETLFGFHVGAGGELQMGRSLVAFIDARLVFMEEPDLDLGPLADESFDLWQVAMGLGLQF
jgi:hypothetical protein